MDRIDADLSMLLRFPARRASQAQAPRAMPHVGGTGMTQAIELRGDYDAAAMRALAARTTRAEVRARMLGIAAVYDGASRAAAAEVAGVQRQILRDWIIRFNAEGPDGLWDSGRTGGYRLALTEDERQILHEIVARDVVAAGRARAVPLDRMLADFAARTGRTLSVRNLSKHIAMTVEASSRGP